MSRSGAWRRKPAGALCVLRRACWRLSRAREVTDVEEPVAGAAEEEKGDDEEVEDDGGEEEVVVEEQEEEAEEELVQTDVGLVDLEDVSWDLAWDAFEEATEHERRLRLRFFKYAAQSIACLEKWRERGANAGDWWDHAYTQAMAEFESCCTPRHDGTGPPHWKELLCESCEKVICHCTCALECACGVRVAKWGWSAVGQTCACSPRTPRTEEWQNILPRWEYRSGPQGRSFERDERRCGDYCSGNGE